LETFFFQAEDGIRDSSVTGVQTCALPIFFEINLRRDAWTFWTYETKRHPTAQNLKNLYEIQLRLAQEAGHWHQVIDLSQKIINKIGRASCRERGTITDDRQ